MIRVGVLREAAIGGVNIRAKRIGRDVEQTPGLGQSGPVDDLDVDGCKTVGRERSDTTKAQFAIMIGIKKLDASLECGHFARLDQQRAVRRLDPRSPAKQPSPRRPLAGLRSVLPQAQRVGDPTPL